MVQRTDRTTFHVIGGWNGPRLASPGSTNGSRRNGGSPSREGTNHGPPRSVSPAPPSAPPSSPEPPAPRAPAPPPSVGLYDLPGLLGRIWSVPAARLATSGSYAAFETLAPPSPPAPAPPPAKVEPELTVVPEPISAPSDETDSVPPSHVLPSSLALTLALHAAVFGPHPPVPPTAPLPPGPPSWSDDRYLAWKYAVCHRPDEVKGRPPPRCHRPHIHYTLSPTEERPSDPFEDPSLSRLIRPAAPAWLRQRYEHWVTFGM